jgi:hypothetical protein
MKPELDSPRGKNPLHSLATARVRPLKANTNDLHFALMKLLPELRIRIYEFIFADLANSLTLRSLSTIQNLNEHLRPRFKSFLKLLRASRILRSGGIEVYCRMAMAQLLALNKIVQHMYTLIGVSGEVGNWKLLMKLHAQQLAMGELGILLRVIRFVVNEGHGKCGWSFAALRTAMAVEEATRMESD